MPRLKARLSARLLVKCRGAGFLEQRNGRVHALAGLRRDLKHSDTWPDHLDIALYGLQVEFGGAPQHVSTRASCRGGTLSSVCSAGREPAQKVSRRQLRAMRQG